MDDDRVDAVVQAALGGGLAGTRLTREQVVRGQDGRAIGEQGPVEVLEVEPLEVDDVAAGGGAAVAEHVGDVLGELRAAAQTGAGGTDRARR